MHLNSNIQISRSLAQGFLFETFVLQNLTDIARVFFFLFSLYNAQTFQYLFFLRFFLFTSKSDNYGVFLLFTFILSFLQNDVNVRDYFRS